MANKILRAGQSRLILEAQLRSVVLRRMITDPKSRFIWSKAVAVFHLACEAYRIEQRLMRTPARLAKRKINGATRIDSPFTKVPLEYQPESIVTPKLPVIKECKKCKTIFFNAAPDYCEVCLRKRR
jgi:hypothetical protein